MTGKSSPRPHHLYLVDGLPPPFVGAQQTIHPAGWELEQWHRHDFFQLVLNKGGEATCSTDRETPIRDGQLAILPPGLSHHWRNAGSGPLDLLNIHISTDADDLTRYLDAVTGDRTIAYACPERLDLLPLAERIGAELAAGDIAHKRLIAALLTEIVIGALRPGIHALMTSRSGPPRPALSIEKALWFIEGNYRRNITLADIARVLHVGPKHACHLFTTELGMPPMKVLRSVRVSKARTLLEHTSHRVSEIASMVGYGDEHHFSRLFKRETGYSPRAWRERHRS